MSMTTDSSSYEYQEPKKKPKKLRSMRLTRLPSLRSSTRRVKSQSAGCPNSVLSGYASSSEQSTPVEMSDASPKAESCCDAKESFQKSARMLSRRSSFRAVKSITRMSSVKFRRPLWKSSANTDLKKKLTKSRSIKVANSQSSIPSSREADFHYDQHSVEFSSDADTSSNYLKPTSCSNERNMRSQASPRISESSVGSNHSSKHSNTSLPNLPSPGSKSTKALVRTSSLKPLRIFTKRASFKSKRPSMTRGSKISQFQSPTVERATCSSTLKESKYPQHGQPGGSESNASSVMKVCTYSYCSLHGHRHADVPPLKRFVSMRRRLLKSQKNVKLEGQVLPKTRRSNNTKRGVRRQQKVCNGDPAVEENAHGGRAVSSITEEGGRDSFIKIYGGPKAKANGIDTYGGENGKTRKIKNLSEIMAHETSFPQLSSGKNQSLIGDFQMVDQHTLTTCLTCSERCVECCCTQMEADRTISAAVTAEEEQGVIMSKTRNGDDFILSEDHSKLNDFSSREFQNHKECDNLSLKRDDNLSTCHKEVAMHGNIQQRSNEDTVSSLKFEKQKNFRLWHLIYQHMVTGLATETETQSSFDGVNKEEQVEDVPTLLGENEPGSSQDRPEADQNVDLEDRDDGVQKIELYKNNAIKLVQEAFDRILSEIPDHSSDNRSVTSETTSYQEFLEENQGGGEELSISNSDSVTDSVMQDPEEIQLEADNFSSSKEEKVASMEGNKSNRQSFKSWNNLKKIITLRRFVKALEKVKNINPREPRYLASEHDPKAEKVHLKQWTMEGNKNSEEWMLDYALRQVICALAPAQKRKVALLVQAFETVIPMPGLEACLRSSQAESSQATCPQAHTESSGQSATETWRENNFGVTLCKRSYPEISCKENPDQVGEFNIVEWKTRAQLEETSLESGCTETAWGTLASNIREVENGDNDPTIRHDQCDIGTPSLNLDGRVTDSNQKVPLNWKTFQEVPSQETKVSDSEVHEADPELSNEKNSDPSNVSTCDREFPTDGQNHPRSSEHAILSSNLEKQKSFTLWHVIYRHMKTGIAAEAESRSNLDGVDKDQVEDSPTFIETNDSGSCHRLSEADQHMNMEDHDDSSQKVELYKTNAIKLVQEAFDRILSEIPDNSSDNQSVTSETMSYQEFSEEHHGDGEELSISKADSISDIRVKDPEGMQRKADNFRISKEEKAASTEKNKSNRNSLKGWSNLKKIIVLKRFVKALEKVRNINPWKPQDLAMEAEKVHLKHQITKEKKRTEEWMFDYALRQVISTLAPAQKRKVALLVQAFETVIPAPQSENHLRVDSMSSSQATKAQDNVESSPATADRTLKESNFGILLRKSAKLDVSFTENGDQVHEFCGVEQHIPEICGQVKETGSGSSCNKTALGTSASSDTTDTSLKEEGIATSSLRDEDNNSTLRYDQRNIGNLLSSEHEEPRLCYMHSLKPDDSLTSNNEKFPVNDKNLPEVSAQQTVDPDSEVHDGDPEFNIEKSGSDNVINTTREQSEKHKMAANEAKLENGYLQKLPPLEESEPTCSNNAAHETQLGKQNYTRLWYLVYKHMAEGSEAKEGNQPLLEGADEADQNMKNQNACARNIGLSQIEAIRLVEEAIDEIPLAEIQDDPSDTQSIASDQIPDDELPEKKFGEGEDFSGPTSVYSANHSFGQSNYTVVEGKRELNPKEIAKEGNKSRPKMQKGWSNLKKMILLKRFIKALEKVKGPQHLLSNPDPDAEKVNLRHQNTMERKNSEEWMLDYALQQVVATLTPARKRKVALLVEAFESVTPPIGR